MLHSDVILASQTCRTLFLSQSYSEVPVFKGHSSVSQSDELPASFLRQVRCLTSCGGFQYAEETRGSSEGTDLSMGIKTLVNSQSP